MDTLLAAMAHDPKDRPTAAEFRDRLSAVVLATPATNGSKSNGSAVLGAVAGKSAEGTVDDQTKAAEEPPLDTEFTSGPAADSPNGGDKPPPEQLMDDPADDRHRSRRRGILAAAVAIILAVAVTVAVANLLPRGNSLAPAGNPVTTAPPTSAASPSSSAEPTPAPTPSPSASRAPGARRAAARLRRLLRTRGGRVLRARSRRVLGECAVLRRRAPDRRASGLLRGAHLPDLRRRPLDTVPRRQSELDAVPEVKKACRDNVVNSMLVNPAERRNDWEVYALPPQNSQEDFFRCIFGRGIRNTPIALKRLTSASGCRPAARSRPAAR